MKKMKCKEAVDWNADGHVEVNLKKRERLEKLQGFEVVAKKGINEETTLY